MVKNCIVGMLITWPISEDISGKDILPDYHCDALPNLPFAWLADRLNSSITSFSASLLSALITSLAPFLFHLWKTAGTITASEKSQLLDTKRVLCRLIIYAGTFPGRPITHKFGSITVKLDMNVYIVMTCASISFYEYFTPNFKPLNYINTIHTFL